MNKLFFTLGMLFYLVVPTKAQITINTTPITVYAKKWSMVNGKSIYSNWTKFKAYTVNKLPGFIPVNKTRFNKYGSNLQLKSKATGFFHTKKINGRWWIVDPNGYANINVAVNAVRQGASIRNKEMLRKKYGSVTNWINQTHHDLINLGFDGVACWSETKSIQLSNKESGSPLSYTLIWNFYSRYNHTKKTNKKIWFTVFDPEFEAFVNFKAKGLTKTKDDPDLLGHFSDNELYFGLKILDGYLSIKDKKDLNYQAAIKFLKKNKFKKDNITDSVRNLFLGVVANKYYKVVSSAIKKYDPNHMYLGSRLHWKFKNNEEIFRAAGKYADIISINFYGKWEPSDKEFTRWQTWSDKPIIITEFYTKGKDTGMANNSGAGWIVKTQKDRGIYYENFCLKLLQQKNCVGWNWFKYMDNDPTDLTSDPSNRDSNKGIVNNNYDQYSPLTKRMKLLNLNRYRLINYFKNKPIK